MDEIVLGKLYTKGRFCKRKKSRQAQVSKSASKSGTTRDKRARNHTFSANMQLLRTGILPISQYISYGPSTPVLSSNIRSESRKNRPPLELSKINGNPIHKKCIAVKPRSSTIYEFCTYLRLIIYVYLFLYISKQLQGWKMLCFVLQLEKKRKSSKDVRKVWKGTKKESRGPKRDLP